MQPVTQPKRFFLLRLDAHYKLIMALLIGGIVFLCVRHNPSVPAVTLLVWTGIASTMIVLDWIAFLWSHPRDIRKIATIEDSSRVLIFLFTMAAALVSLLGIYLLLRSTQGQSHEEITGNVFLAMTAVVISWWMVHTVFTMRYAHLYYNKDEYKSTERGGLDFPGDDKEPDYLDFVYFSFVIGMTFQVSDVTISSKRIRRLAWAHGLISFAFNTAIVALSINVISGLVSK